MDLHNATASLRERERVPDGFGLAGNVRARFQVHFNVVTVYIIVVFMVTNELMSWFRRFSNMNTTSCMEGLDPCETTTTVPPTCTWGTLPYLTLSLHVLGTCIGGRIISGHSTYM